MGILQAEPLQLLGHRDVLADHAARVQHFGTRFLRAQHLGREIDLSLLVDRSRHDVELLGFLRGLEALARQLAVLVVLRHGGPFLSGVAVGQCRGQLLCHQRMLRAEREHVLHDGLVQVVREADRADRRHAELLDERQRGLPLRRARQRRQRQHLVDGHQLAHALNRSRNDVAVVFGNQAHLAAVDAALRVDLGHRDLDADVVGHAQQRRGAGERKDVANDDLGIGHALLLRRCGHGHGGGQDAERRDGSLAELHEYVSSG